MAGKRMDMGGIHIVGGAVGMCGVGMGGRFMGIVGLGDVGLSSVHIDCGC